MKRLCALMALACACSSGGRGQVLLSPRAIALGAYDVVVRDVRGFAANPAGLVFMKDWDIYSTTYIATGRKANGFVFNGFGIGKTIADDVALAFQYTPGALVGFSIPSTEHINGQTISSAVTVSYQEELTVAASYRFGVDIAAGFGLRMKTAIVSDPQFQFQIKDSTIVPIPNQSQLTTWLFDPAVLWKPSPSMTLSVVGRGIARFNVGSLPGTFARYQLPETRELELGVGYSPSVRLHLSGELSTAKTGAVGAEWLPGLDVSIRGGLYCAGAASRFVNAVSIGSGWTYRFLDMDIAYLHFTDQRTRTGTAPMGGLDVSEIRNISMNPFTTDQLVFSMKAAFGSIRESLTRIEGVNISSAIYPSAANAFVYHPLGMVKVRNTSEKPVEAKASFYLDRYMDAPTESPTVRIAPGDTAELPVTAVLNDHIQSVTAAVVRDADVRVISVAGEDYDDRTQAHVLIHGRNDWDGDVLTLRYFVTPGEPEVIRYSRDILLAMRDSLSAVPREMEVFQEAKLLFNAFAGKLMYVSDPKLTANYVQYPVETLSLRGGDCDDMTVCFASLLASIGISCAFVDVVPPEHPDDAHVYLLFDTGMDPQFATLLSENPKRYTVRRNSKGIETLWIPVESTVITEGFARAWARGAEEHFQHTNVDLGQVKGWVKVVDVY